jgi:peptidoglycan/LPS O-acetylase OafA/YrhL
MPSKTDAGSPSYSAAVPAHRHLAFMDGLRAVAVLLVVCCHAAKYTMDMHDGWPFHALFEGAHGVDLFFVISGFCLSYPFLRRVVGKEAAHFDLVTFFSRRVVRIVPTYWIAFFAVLAVAIAVARAGGDLPWPTIKMPTLATALAQLFFLSPGNMLVGSFWTLPIEVRWYVVFPFLLWLYSRKPLLVGAIGAISVGLYWFAGQQIWDLATLPGFLLGIFAADLVLREHPIVRFAPLLFVVSIPVSLLLEPHGHLVYALQNQLWWQVTAFFLVLGASARGPINWLLSTAPAVFIGTTAYSIYLLSDPVEAWYGHYGGASPIVAIVSGVAIGVLGWILVERQFTDPVSRDRWVRRADAMVSWLQRLLRAPRSISLTAAEMSPPR